MREVHVVVPDAIDDRSRPSGGNVYDREVCHGLAAAGWRVVEHPITGAWPAPGATVDVDLAATLDRLPVDALVVVDGLIASATPAAIVPRTARLRIVVLVHLPLGDRARAFRARERTVLEASSAVVTTSEWTRRRLIELYGLPAGKVHAATPGVAPAELAAGSRDGRSLLCVAAVVPDKGHDVLVDALTLVAGEPWRLVCVGSVDRDPPFVASLRTRVAAAGLADRVEFAGVRVGTDLDRSYDAADLFVLPSRAETFGMVVSEALARGVPVLASDVGGVPEAVGGAEDDRPALLVPPGDATALAGALGAWFADGGRRARLRRAARARRLTLASWTETSAAVGRVLVEVRAAP